MSETTISERFEIEFTQARYAPKDSPVKAGEFLPAHWELFYEAGGREWAMALQFPTRRQAEIALAACERLGITPAIYNAAGRSPAGSGELRRRIMEMFPW